MNSLINSTPATIHDEYGNDIVEIPINVASKTLGTVSLNNLAFKYNYTVCIDKNPVHGNLTNSLNAILPHGGDGNKSITIAVRSDYYGKVKLSDLFVKYFIPQVTVDHCKVIDGLGVIKNKCYAGYQPYTLQVGAWSSYGLNDIKDVVIALDSNAPGGPFVKLKWNRTSNTFSKIYDPSNYFTLASISCQSSNDGIDSWLLNFTGTFSWSYPNEDLVSCLVNITYDSDKYVTRNVKDTYYVENDLTFVGTLKVTGEYQGSLSDGDWVRSNEKLTWTGLKVVYEGTTNLYPPNSAFAVTVSDDANRKWYNTSSSGSEFIIHSWSQTSTDTSDIHSIDITNITGTCQDISDIDFEVKIDGTPPLLPTDIVCYSKGPGSGSTEYDIDTTVYVNFTVGSWQDSESGLAGNFMGYNNTEPTMPAACGDSAVGEEGLATFYVRARDNVGNWGTTGSASIFIDLTSVKFSDPYPGPEIWSTNPQIQVGVMITDIGGSGVAGNAIQYRYTNDGLLDSESWLDYPETESLEQINTLTSINFGSVGSPVVQWRAKDVANQDNAILDSYVTSPQYSVNIDTESPTIDFISQKTWQRTLTPDLMLYINDTGRSGVDVSSVMYAFSIDDGVTYSDWLSVEAQPTDGNYNKTVVIFNEEFVEGTGNWIKCKVSDIAGNEVISESEQIFIDISPPVYDKVTPTSDEWNTSTDISAGIRFMDNFTALDPDTIKYRLKWHGEDFGKWTKYTGANPGKEINVNVMLAFTEGKYNAVQWRVADTTGNLLVTPQFTIRIDLTDVTFTDSIPIPDKWQCKTNLFYGITINDVGGSGVDASTIQFRISNDGTSAYDAWHNYDLAVNSDIIMINQTRSFPEGSDNYIQWRAKDLAGNGYTLSPSYHIKVDCTPVKYSDPTPDPDEVMLKREQTAGITLTDLISGIDISSVAYSIKTDKDSSWNDWTTLSLKNVEDKTSIEVSTELNLPATRMNLIRWRAIDIAGNNQISSPYNIQIDAPPVAVLVSPANNEEFLSSQMIFFDGTKSYDPDKQDMLTYSWKSDIAGMLGTGNSISTTLSKGKHTIEFSVSDPYSLSDSVSINVIITELSTKAELRDDLLSPGSGTTETEFTFSVHYNDERGNAPDSVIVVIDGIEFDMKLKEGEKASDGIYEYKTRLSKGVHAYYYKAETRNKIPVPGKDSVPTESAFPKSTTEITEPVSDFKESGSWALITVIIIIFIVLVLLFLLFRKRRIPFLTHKETGPSPPPPPKKQARRPATVPYSHQQPIRPVHVHQPSQPPPAQYQQPPSTSTLSPSPHYQTKPQYPCRNCGYSLTFVHQYHRWYCDRCRKYD